MTNASEWETVKVITNLHTLIVFHFESDFQSKCVSLMCKTINFRFRV